MIKKLVLTLVAVVLLVGGAWGAWRQYQVWQYSRSVHLAERSLDAADLENAALSIRRALKIRPDGLEACRQMARLTKKLGLPISIAWHKRVAELDPRDLEVRLEWAELALGLDEPDAAAEALTRVSSAEQAASPRYFELLGRLLEARGHLAEAGKAFAEAVALDPGNEAREMALASNRLALDDEKLRESGRAALEKLLSRPELRDQSLRALIRDAVRSQDFARALELSARIREGSGETFGDRLVRLGILEAAGDSGFQVSLAGLEKEIADEADKVAALASWLNRHGRPAEVLRWFGELPEAITKKEPLLVLRGESHAALGDWAGLQSFIDRREWGRFEFMRLTFAARCLRESGRLVASRARWTGAVQAAEGVPGASDMLFRIASAWGWKTEAIELLWARAAGTTRPVEALVELRRYYQDQHDAEGLYRVYTRFYELTPKDMIVMNNLASYSLLLNRGAERGRNLAREVYLSDRENIVFASTYAFALYREGKTAEAVETLRKFDRSLLEVPPIAAYFGVFLAENGEVDTAGKYLELARKAMLLPEEQALVESARSVVQSAQ